MAEDESAESALAANALGVTELCADELVSAADELDTVRAVVVGEGTDEAGLALGAVAPVVTDSLALFTGAEGGVASVDADGAVSVAVEVLAALVPPDDAAGASVGSTAPLVVVGDGSASPAAGELLGLDAVCSVDAE